MQHVEVCRLIKGGCVVSRVYGDQYGEVGELDGSNNSSDLLSQSSEQLESPLPPPSSLDPDRRGKRS